MDRNVKECDVFGTLHNVHRCRVEITTEPLEEGQPRPLVFCEHKDLGNRALKRLVKFNKRGLAPPAKREKDSPDG